MIEPQGPDRDAGAPRRESDLSAFARSPSAPRRPRRIWTRATLALLALGFLALLFERSYDAWMPKRKVTVIRPSAIETGDPVAASRSVVAEAAGFVEAEPEAWFVTPRVDGVYAEVLRRTGDRVDAGELLARIDEIDIAAELAVAESAAVAARAANEAAQRRLELARRDHDLAFDLEAALETAVAAESASEEEARLRESAVRGAEAGLEIARLELERESLLAEKGVSGPKQLEIAAARRTSAVAQLDIQRAEAATARAAVLAAKAETKRARAAFENRIALAREWAEASAAAQDSAAREVAAFLRAERAARDLDRCRLVAPINGVIARSHAIPGARTNGDDHAFALFDPSSLRCRVDVPLGRVANVSLGQAARITPEGMTTALRGEVVRVSGEADVAKVALRVHVKILEAHPALVPERVCHVEFLGAGSAEATTSAADDRARGVSIPARALRNDGSVMVLDARGIRAVRRAISSKPAADPNRVVVASGLDLSDKVIVDPDVADGERVEAIEAEP